MRFVIIGGTGLIGGKVVNNLRGLGHEVVAASPKSGVNTLTGEGLAEALAGADVVVDVSNSPSFEDRAVLEFFETSGRNLIAAERAAGVGHHVALSIVGADRVPDSGYIRAKIAQEALIKGSGVPYTILRATQFLEFLDAIAASGTEGDTVRLPAALLQPVAADDVAAALTEIALADPANGTVEIAGPEARPFAEIIGRHLSAKGDPRRVVADPDALYFGTRLDERSLVPLGDSRIGKIDLERWTGRTLSPV